jgi:TM2 domain-containing membrane protein YozV
MLENNGLRGVIAINLSGGFVFALWLLFGALDVPIHGKIILWPLRSDRIK